MNSNEELWKEINTAIFISFQQRNKSPQSQQLSVDVTEHILSREVRRRVRKTKDKAAFIIAAERTLASLMLAANTVDSRWAYRALGNDTFSGEIFTIYTFKKVVSLMEIAGFMEKDKGGNRSNPFHTGEANSKAYHPGKATRFRVTDSLLTIAASYGITMDNIKSHYLRALPTNVIKKRAASIQQNGRKISGRQLPIKKDDKVLFLEHQVKRINEYLDKQHLENAVFNGYHRTFNMGDEPDFDWNKGGRLSSPGKDNYQRPKKEQRLSTMRINHESIAEVDINASYLSIFYGMAGHKLPKKDDLYKVPGLHRDIVKAWITAAFGNGAFPTRWPSDSKAKLIDKGICMDNLTMKKVGERVCDSIPVLKHWPTSKITWADLMFKESCAIVSAMESLRENFNIPAYSMHDGLIVPLSGKDIAASEIMRAFDDLGLECRVKIETQA
tara:strand:+ start:104 stop:1429 length:1326 start_codon:yes stop_codon:yes gene_type:complete